MPLPMICIAFLGMIWSIGCGDDPPPAAPKELSFPIKVSVTDGDNEGVPKVPVLVDGKPVGYTDKDGKFSASLNDQVGRSVTLSLGLLTGYKHTEDPIFSDVLKASAGVKGAIQPMPISLDAKMVSTNVNLLIWVSADCDDTIEKRACANIPVKVNDEVVGNTDAHGHTHFTYKTTPNKVLKVTLDTPSYSSDDPDSFQMVPFKPEYEIKAGSKSKVFYIDEGFSSGDSGPKKKTRRRKTTRRRKPATRRIVKKKSSRKKRKKKKKKDSGVISIF